MSFITALKQQLYMLTSQRDLELLLQLSPFVRVVLRMRLLKSCSLKLSELLNVSTIVFSNKDNKS
jgi:hypothetical protein